MKKNVKVILSPLLLNEEKITNKIVVVVDILRASSTILTLFHKKVKYAIPTDNLKECKKYKKKGFLTIAERMGRKVEGFDFGNSPSKLMNENLAGKKIAMCTSNGTKSIIKCKKFNKVLIGCFLNFKYLTKYLMEKNSDILILCSGRKESLSLEDTLFAGALVESLSKYFKINSDSSYLSRKLYLESKSNILDIMMNSSHSKKLSSYKNVTDIEFCSQQSVFELIPIFSENKLILL